MTLFNYKQADSNSTITKRDLLYLLLFVLILLGVVYFFYYKRKSDLKSVNYTWGVITDKTSVYLDGNSLYVNYYLKGEKFDSDEIKGGDCFSKLDIGDTVLIKYSVTNPKTVEIESCYWNDKTKEKLHKLKKKKGNVTIRR